MVEWMQQYLLPQYLWTLELRSLAQTPGDACVGYAIICFEKQVFQNFKIGYENNKIHIINDTDKSFGPTNAD
jgi:hypothetical protein